MPQLIFTAADIPVQVQVKRAPALAVAMALSDYSIIEVINVSCLSRARRESLVVSSKQVSRRTHKFTIEFLMNLTLISLLPFCEWLR